jgi:hypothetical protein
MHTTDFTARFGFTKLERVWMDCAAVFCLLAAVLFAFGLVFAIPRIATAKLWVAFLITGCLVGYLTCLARLHLKYRYVMWLRYGVSSRGILVEENGREQLVRWEDVEIAEYMPVVSVFRLLAKDQRRPMVLFTLELGGKNDVATRRSKLAEVHIRAGMSGRLKNLWIPW